MVGSEAFHGVSMRFNAFQGFQRVLGGIRMLSGFRRGGGFRSI